MSQEQKDKLRLIMKGRKPCESTMVACRAARLGSKMTPEQKDKISRANKGKPKPPGFAEHLSKIMTGKHPSHETRDKMRAAKLGKPGNRTGSHPSIESRKKMSERLLGKCGPESRNWKGGIAFEPYCPKFNDTFKERVRAFFGHQCQMCGHLWQRGETSLHVHHVNYRKDACCAKDVKPLFVPLCNGCHGKTQGHRAFWEDWFTEIINEFHGGECYEELKK